MDLKKGTVTVHDQEAFVRYRTWVKVKAQWKLLKKMQKFIDKEMQEIKDQWGDIMDEDNPKEKKKDSEAEKRRKLKTKDFIDDVMDGY